MTHTPSEARTPRPRAEYRWTNRKAHAFLDALACHGKVAAAARAVGMTRQSAYKLRQRVPVVAEGLGAGAGDRARAAARRAGGGGSGALARRHFGNRKVTVLVAKATVRGRKVTLFPPKATVSACFALNPVTGVNASPADPFRGRLPLRFGDTVTLLCTAQKFVDIDSVHHYCALQQSPAHK